MGFPAGRRWRNSGITQSGPSNHSPGSALTLPCSLPSQIPFIRIHPGTYQSWSLIPSKTIRDVESGFCVVPRLSQSGHRPYTRQMLPICLYLQGYRTSLQALCVGVATGSDCFVYYPMIERGGGSREPPSQQPFQPPERHKTSERNNLLLLKPRSKESGL